MIAIWWIETNDVLEMSAMVMLVVALNWFPGSNDVVEMTVKVMVMP